MAMTLPAFLAEIAAQACRDPAERCLVLITRSEGPSICVGTEDTIRETGEAPARDLAGGDADLVAACMVAPDGTETWFAEPAQTPGWLTWDQLTSTEQRIIAMGAYGPPGRMPSGRPVSRDNWLVLGGSVRP